ncbi:MAG: hypothetical protein JWO43_639 [Candidatus Adlerbacteria bacterium]|nr:hypothetical protein [Candidatus Adlerbacteria bacterium]
MKRLFEVLGVVTGGFGIATGIMFGYISSSVGINNPTAEEFYATYVILICLSLLVLSVLAFMIYGWIPKSALPLSSGWSCGLFGFIGWILTAVAFTACFIVSAKSTTPKEDVLYCSTLGILVAIICFAASANFFSDTRRENAKRQ